MYNKRPMNVVYLRNKKIPKERLDKIQEMLLEGYSYEEIGKAVGKSRSAIQHTVRNYGLTKISQKERNKLHIPEGVDKAKELLQTGMKQSDVAKAVGVSQGTISLWINKYNIDVVPHEYQRGPKSTETEEDIELLKKLLAEKKNITEISNIMNRSFACVDNWIQKYNLDDSHIKRYKKT